MTHKEALLSALAGQNRGLLAGEREKVKLLSAIAQLEDSNPTPEPLSQPELLEGDWRLLYTTSQELLSFDRFPFLKTGQIYQCIRTQDARVYNLAEIKSIPILEGLLAVCAQYEKVSEQRVNVYFKRSIIGLQSWLKYQTASEFIEAIEAGTKFPPIDFSIEDRDRQGWLDITYLDETLRIGRGNQGSVFVLTKDS